MINNYKPFTQISSFLCVGFHVNLIVGHFWQDFFKYSRNTYLLTCILEDLSSVAPGRHIGEDIVACRLVDPVVSVVGLLPAVLQIHYPEHSCYSAV